MIKPIPHVGQEADPSVGVNEDPRIRIPIQVLVQEESDIKEITEELSSEITEPLVPEAEDRTKAFIDLQQVKKYI